LRTNNEIPHWLSKQASLHPEKVAIEDPEGLKLTFQELQRNSESFARKLANFPIEKGTRIALLSNNKLEMIYAIHALSYLGAIVVLLNTRLTSYELTDQLNRSEAKLLITTESLQEEKDLAFTHTTTFHEINGLEEANIALNTEINLEDPFTMMFTSGTTGAPKAVLHTYGNHWWSAVGSVLNLGLHDHDKWLLTLPLFHVGGLSILIRSVMYGMTVYFMEKYDQDQLLDAFINKKVTIASLVTVMLKDLTQKLEDRKLPSSVRCILLGGGSVPEPLLQKVEQLEIPLFQSYGMTETSSQIATLSKTYARKKLGSAGKPLFPAQIKIHKPDTEGVGEIIVKGPMVFHGYDQLQEENKRAFNEGWFLTGDLGYIDEDGFLYVVDRRTDLIISGGENIYPSEVEQALLAHEVVKDVAVVGKEDEEWGQVPVAFVVVSDNIEGDTLISFAKQRIASYKVPKQIIFMDKLPRNASNKVMRHRLAEKLRKI